MDPVMIHDFMDLFEFYGSIWILLDYPADQCGFLDPCGFFWIIRWIHVDFIDFFIF